MRKIIFSNFFEKAISSLKGKEAENLYKKIEQISTIEDINHYKNLKKPLQKYKRVHINDSYIILFFGDNQTIYFVDYDHHDKIYLKKYNEVKFK